MTAQGPSTTSFGRIHVVARALLHGQWWAQEGGGLPLAPLLLQAALALALCGLVHGELPAYSYGIWALTIPLALTSLSLLGELGPLLRADPAAEWIGAQPLKPVELRAARVVVLVVLIGLLALASLVPAALLAPPEAGLGGRLALVAAGLVQTLFVAAVLLWLQALLGERAEGLLVLVQTAVFTLVLVGAVVGLRHVPELAALQAPGPLLLAFPPAWFATPLLESPFASAGAHAWLAVGAGLATLVTLLVAPFPSAGPRRGGPSPLERVLHPLRLLALRLWLTREERGPFDLVYEGLGRERDFVVRAYPLIAIPLAFLFLGADPDDPRGAGLTAILLFSPAIYLPVLLVHVPATATPQASWLLEAAPVSPGAIARGAQKAIFLRFLVPLHVLLLCLAVSMGGAALALQVAPVGAVATIVALRLAWGSCVSALPMSLPADELGSAWQGEFSKVLFALGGTMAVLALCTAVALPNLAWGLGIGVAFAAWEVARVRATT